MHSYSRHLLPFALVIILFVSAGHVVAQTASTGMVLGTVKDASGAYVPGATIRLTQLATNLQRTARSDEAGRYTFPLLEPGLYEMEVSLAGFATVRQTDVKVRVTERTVLDVVLEVAPVVQTVTVQATPQMIQSASSTLGRVVEERQLVNLPLATRNYTQILALSPGVATNVADAGTLGRNSLEISAQGGRLSDNNVEINGADANNGFVTTLGEESGSQGIAVPAPDTIQEFKVQTALYDASTGRNGGANVNVVTKSGSNDFHGTLYEFFRNDKLNANDFFRNRQGLPKPRLRQNQFGFTLGGPLRKQKAFFFVSYEGNRQSNGVTDGASSTAFLPPLTNDRSPATLGSQFGGQTGFFGGVAVAPDGSNINPVALDLLNARLPNGAFLVPTPQVILPTGIGQSIFSKAADFDENQFNLNIDYVFSSSDSLSGKYFFADTDTVIPFGGGATVPGFPSTTQGRNQNLVLSWKHVFGPKLLNEARIAYTRLDALTDSAEPIPASAVGINTPVTVTGIPNIGFLSPAFNFAFGAGTPPLGSTINNFQFADSIAYTHGPHRMRMGAEFKRTQVNVLFDFDKRAVLRFFTFADFLLGLPWPLNGAPLPVSNVFVSVGGAGLFGRAQRSNDLAFYFQDDIALHPQLTLNLGIRYEFFGQVRDNLGRLANFDPALAVPVPPPTGTFSGFVVASNTVDTEPGEVLRLGRDTVISNDKNNWGPRLGFAYQPFPQKGLLIRGGYGAYFSRPGTVIPFQTGANLPFALIATRVGPLNFAASLQDPFVPALPAPGGFPVYLARNVPSPLTPPLRVNALDPSLRAPTVHQWSLSLQYGFAQDYLLEVGYVGTRGTGLLGQLTFNQPLLASPTSPVHGETTNTIANAQLRAPFQGVDPQTSQLFTNAFDSNYNALQVSVTKRFGHGLQFLASYTWSHNIDNLGFGPGTAVGGFQGDVRDLDSNRASADTDRRHRFVYSFYWELPRFSPESSGWSKLLNGWAFAGIATFQSGLPFSIVDTSAGTLFASTNSRAQLAPGATLSDIDQGGSVNGRLDEFFNTSGFTFAPAIGDDCALVPPGFPCGTGFGNSPRSFLRGPDQRNVDLAIVKRTTIGWPNEAANIEFRTELFNAFNTVNFGQPGNDFASPATFGVINTTTVAARVIQFALKLNF